jgi:hypothetical protein
MESSMLRLSFYELNTNLKLSGFVVVQILPKDENLKRQK